MAIKIYKMQCSICGARANSFYQNTALASTCMHNSLSYEYKRPNYRNDYNYNYNRNDNNSAKSREEFILFIKSVYNFFYFIFSGELYRYIRNGKMYRDFKEFMYRVYLFISELVVISIMIISFIAMLYLSSIFLHFLKAHNMIHF